MTHLPRLVSLAVALTLVPAQWTNGQVTSTTTSTTLNTATTTTAAVSTTTTTSPPSTDTTTTVLPPDTTTSTTPPTTATTTTPISTTTTTTTATRPAGACGVNPARGCEDGISCTEDSCVDGSCSHVPVNARCDTGRQCAIGTCRPHDPAADSNGCVSVPAGAGGACTDDGFSCTDDVCGPAGCLHVPIDSRCVPPGECTNAVCAPERLDHDATGCAPGPPLSDGQECAEDGDPCTVDVCRHGGCAHEPMPRPATCIPVQGAFRETLALQSLARVLMADGAGRVAVLAARLGRTEATLGMVARVLAGKSVGPLPAARPRPGLVETPAEQRARMAAAVMRRTPRDVVLFLGTLRDGHMRTQLGRPVTRDLHRRGRLLLEGTRALKAELRRLQQVTMTFAR